MSASLAGFTVGVTAHRRAAELGGMLERYGARVCYGPAMRIVTLPDDGALHDLTNELVTTPPDIVVVMTGQGLRGWLEAAQGWDRHEGLRAVLDKAIVLTRGPKARGAVRAAGLSEHWSPESESSSEVLEYLLTRGVSGARVAVQLHGDPQAEFTAALTETGAEVIRVPVYRWEPPHDCTPLDKLLNSILAGSVSAVTFTSAPAAAGLLRRAADRGVEQRLIELLGRHVLAACVGAVTAEPLATRGVSTLQPARARTAALVRTLAGALPERTPTWQVGGHRLILRDHGALVDDELRTVAPAPMAILRALASRPGHVLSRDDQAGLPVGP